MEITNKKVISVETTIQLPTKRVWELWTTPEHIMHWNFASDEWHCPTAENDLKPGGLFSWRMETKDQSVGFDYSGVYDLVTINKQIVCTLDDGRQVTIDFTDLGEKTTITETFEVEDINSIDQQKAGWQAILDNFKKYAETKN